MKCIFLYVLCVNLSLHRLVMVVISNCIMLCGGVGGVPLITRKEIC